MKIDFICGCAVVDSMQTTFSTNKKKFNEKTLLFICKIGYFALLCVYAFIAFEPCVYVCMGCVDNIKQGKPLKGLRRCNYSNNFNAI